MDGRGAGPHADAVASPLLDDLRVLQLQLLHGGQDDAVARFAGGDQCRSHLVVGLAHLGKLRQQLHQVAVVGDGQAGALGQRGIEQAAGQADIGLCDALPQIHGGYAGGLHILRVLQGCQIRRQLPDAAQTGSTRRDALVQLTFDGVLAGQGVHPRRQKDVQLL